MLRRREVIGSLAGAAVGYGALKGTGASADDAPKKPAFVLVHGSWHGAWCFSKLLALLSRSGHIAIARDLPGHGALSKYPPSLEARSSDDGQLANERSPLAGVTLDDYVSDVMGTIDSLILAGNGPVVLVGHSMGGIPITALGETAPQKIRTLVYLSAFMPASGVPAAAYLRSPESAGGKLAAALKGDPARSGALRIDPRATDAEYSSNLKSAFAANASQEDWAVVQRFLSPDDPAQPFSAPIATSQSRWGSIPRAYIRCTEDFAIRPALQDRFISAADQFTPDNKTVVREMNSDHSPFLSQAEELAAILVNLAV